MNNQNNLWKIGVWVGVLLAVFLAVISIKEIKSIAYVGKDRPITNNISVNGTGDAYAIPDIATFSFGVTERGNTVVEAQKKATDRINRALEAVHDEGVADKDIKTVSYSINPHYDYTTGICNEFRCPPGESKLTGYDVSQTIEIKVRDLEKAGGIFAAIGSLGVQNVSGLTFSVDDIDVVKAVARGKAIDQAQNRAKELAKQLGVRLVRVISFYDTSNQIPMAYEANFRDAMSVKSTVPEIPQIPAGEQKVIANVTITYEIR